MSEFEDEQAPNEAHMEMAKNGAKYASKGYWVWDGEKRKKCKEGKGKR